MVDNNEDLKKSLDERTNQLNKTLSWLESFNYTIYSFLPEDLMNWHKTYKGKMNQ